MPIYAYKCSVCGHTQDVLQKMSDDPLSVCPSCGAASFSKQVTAAGFQLKGSGWYVTDFRDGGNKSAASGEAGASASATTTVAPSSTATEAAPASAAPAPAAPAPSSSAGPAAA